MKYRKSNVFAAAILLFISANAVYAESRNVSYNLISRENSQDFVEISVPLSLDTNISARNETYSIVLLTFFPDFSALKDNKNQNFGKDCAGYCGGRIIITMMYNYSSKGESPISSFYNYVSSIKDAVVFGGKFDKTEDRYITYRIGNNQSNFVEEYSFISDSKNINDYNTSFTCKPLAAYPSCTADFLLDCDRRVKVHISSISFKNITELVVEKNKITRFLQRMIKNSACQII